MPKHRKYPAMNREEVSPFTIRVLLNPEYADDDIVIKALAEMEREWFWIAECSFDPCEAHGFNCHDPFEFSMHEHMFLNSACASEDHTRIEAEQSVHLEDLFERFPHTQSFRMGAREVVGYDRGSCRWNWRRVRGKRCKPSRRPFVKDWYKSA